MHLHLVIESSDVAAVKKLLSQKLTHSVVRARIKKNVVMSVEKLSRDDFWLTQLMCLITTQNKSGTGSAIDEFLSSQPFTLSWQQCNDAKDRDAIIENTFSHLHIRRWKTSADFARQNFYTLEKGGWNILDELQERLMVQRNQSPVPNHYILEREVAQNTQNLLRGLGPKQSRNFWQYLGLFRYEIPLDSRILRWLENHLDFYVPSNGLADESYYCQIMDVMRELALRAEMLPCVLDAAIFASYEKM